VTESLDAILTVDVTDTHIVHLYQLLDIWLELASEEKFESIRNKSIEALDRYSGKEIFKIPILK
jgi:hypothetical protein